jgi:hypothetical protein
MLSNTDKNLMIKFNKFFYRKESIETAKKAYTNLCEPKIEDHKGYFLVTLSQIKKEINPSKLRYEFSNFVLSLQG